MRKRFLIDSILNIISSLMFTFVTQLIVYPFLGRDLSESTFGNLLTIIGLINAFGVIFGGSLNNLRLIRDETQKLKDENYNLILYRSMIINTILIFFSLLFFKNTLSFLSIFILIITCNLILLRSYLTVYYRLKLKYNYILYHMVFTSIGYLFGLLIYQYVKNWTVIFIIGEACSLFFLILTTKFVPVFSWETTTSFIRLEKEFYNLSLSNSISNIMLYLDRLLLNPLLGAADVGVFFAASLFGKLSGVILQPLSGVILTYISKNEKISPWKMFKILFLSSFFFGGVLFACSIFIAPIFIKIFYPVYYGKVIGYYILANLAAIILIVSNLLQPMSLKYCNIKWQIFIQSLYGVMYFSLGIFLTNSFKLKGFVYSVLIANVIRYLAISILLFCNLYKRRENT